MNRLLWSDDIFPIFQASDTPGHGVSAMTPGRRNRWDETPRTERETPGHRDAGWAETPRTDRGGADKIESTPSAGMATKSFFFTI